MYFGFDLFSKWRPTAEEFAAPLTTPLPFRPKFDCFPRGIDNFHVDVVLSDKLASTARQLIHTMIQHDADESLSWKSAWVLPPNAREMADFQLAYENVMATAMGMARKLPRRELMQLVEFAAMKFLLMAVGDELDVFRDDLQQQRDQGPDSKKTMQVHEQFVAFVREMPAIRHRVTLKLFGHVLKVEVTSLRKMRKSLLGYSWPVPRTVMFNPVLLLSNLWSEEQVMRNYPLVGINPEKLQEFTAVNRVITGLFADYLPAWVQPPPPSPERAEMEGGKRPLRLRADQGSLPGFLDVELLLNRAMGEDEYQHGKTSWLDEPANLKQALQASLPPPADPKRCAAFQANLLKDAQARFASLGLLKRIYAAQEAPAIFDELRGQVPVRLIVEYLEGAVPPRLMVKRLGNMKGAVDPAVALKRLNAGEAAMRRLSQAKRKEYLVDFMVGFASLRRDLKLAYRAYWSMNQIRLLKEPAHIELSRNNRTLYEFVLSEERLSDQKEIRGHAILKADLRGSSRMIRELRERNLNPATHFSLNFFDPITGMLERFGAKKVFVEGDAVILAFYEYQEVPHDWLAIARAAGLARDILRVVDAQNAKNHKHGLPELELGMGIAWLAEAPAFLYDGDHEITISSAINRADRLSSCAAPLRKTAIGETLPRGVEAVLPVGQGIPQKDSGDGLLRYNVNGIELDPLAFHKLQGELALHKVAMPFPQYGPHSVFYIGRYPDKRGFMQWLAVREAPVRQWVGNDVGEVDTAGRVFYEVITDAEVIETLKGGQPRQLMLVKR